MLKNNKSIAVGAAAGAFAGVLLLAGVYYVYVGGGKDPAEPSVQVAPPIEESDAYVPVETSPGPVIAQLPAHNVALVDEDAAHEHEHGDPEMEKLRSQEKFAKNEARWAMDTAEPIESTRLEQTVLSATGSEALREVHFKPEAVEVQCKSSMCRIETKFAPGADTTEWATRLLLSTGGEFGNVNFVGERLPDGKQRMVMYSYRPGTSPPQ